MGFVFMLRWLHINLCKWGLWLYFHEASKEETTGLLPMKKPERTKAENMAESRSSPPSLQRQAFSHRRHYTAQLWKDRFAMQCASVRVCVWIPTLGDEGKSSVAEWRMKSTSQSDKQIVKRLRNENRKRWTEGAQRWRSLFFSSKSWIKPRGERGVKISQENITTMQSRNQTVLVSKTNTVFWRTLLQMLQFRTGPGIWNPTCNIKKPEATLSMSAGTGCLRSRSLSVELCVSKTADQQRCQITKGISYFWFSVLCACRGAVTLQFIPIMPLNAHCQEIHKVCGNSKSQNNFHTFAIAF